MNSSDALDNLALGLERYNESIDAALNKTNDTQPLAEDQAPTLNELLLKKTILEENQRKADNYLKRTADNTRFYLDNQITREQLDAEIANHKDIIVLPEPHIHGPFTFLMNQNHNALRGCQSCGQTWVGAMAGYEGDLRWHAVGEPPEEEE